MNILYFGPIRYDNDYGFSARNIVESLSTRHNIDIQNLFLDSPYNNSTIIDLGSRDIKNFKLKNNYDCIIEHCPIDMMHIDKSLCEKNICIPILSDFTLNLQQISKLQQFDLVVSDNTIQHKLLKDNNIKYIPLSYNLSKNNNEYNIDFGYHLFNKKFYFVGDFKNDHNIIQKIIVSFLISFRNRSDVSLVLFCSDDDRESATKALSEMIGSICDKMHYTSRLIPIKTFVNKLGHQDLHIIHKSCDVFLDIYDSYKPGINRQIAALYHKNIIDISNLDNVCVPLIEYSTGHGNLQKYSFLTNSLIKAMTSTLNKKITITNNINQNIIDILDILC